MADLERHRLESHKFKACLKLAKDLRVLTRSKSSDARLGESGSIKEELAHSRGLAIHNGLVQWCNTK